MRAAGFKGLANAQDGGMQIETGSYAELSEKEMAAADRAQSLEECQAHLYQALRYAQFACLERPQFHPSNVVAIGSARRSIS